MPASLNQAKRSVSLAFHTPAGREIAQALITAPGPDAGILLTNLPAGGWMDSATLSARRPDLLTLRLTGNHDGSAAVDCTVNCASGFPVATGRADGLRPRIDGRPVTEVDVAVHALNRMLDLGYANSVRVAQTQAALGP